MQGEFGKQWQLQKDAVDKLKDQLRTLNDKIEEAKRKKNILIARQKRAEAQKAIQDTMRGLSDTSAFDTFERMSQKVDQIEAEAEASTELGGELAGRHAAAEVQGARRRDGSGQGARRAEGEDGPRPGPRGTRRAVGLGGGGRGPGRCRSPRRRRQVVRAPHGNFLTPVRQRIAVAAETLLYGRGVQSEGRTD